MILKEADDRSGDLAELERLHSASDDERQRSAIKQQILMLRSGVRGERDAAHFLNREFGASENVLIVHDLRFQIEGEFAQIDHLVLHRVQRSAWVLETKNHAGRLTCDEHGDWTVWRGSKPQSIASPINQARRQCEWLRLWLERNGIKPLRKIEPVVLISPTSSMNRKHLGPSEHVVKSDNFRAWWDQQTDAIGLVSALGIVGKHLTSGMSKDEFLALGQRLLSAHVKQDCAWTARFTAEEGSASSKSPAAEKQTVEGTRAAEQTFPLSVKTGFGVVTITRVSDGLLALRNEKNPELIEVVCGACKGRARWQPRYRNWLLRDADLPTVLMGLEAGENERSGPVG